MRIEKKGNRRSYRALRKVLMPLLALAPMLLVASACSNGKKAPVDSSKLSKSTLSDTTAATGQSANLANGARKARVVILGTSLTAGLGLDPSEAYPALLQQLADSAKFNVNIVAAGLSGETSAGALRRASWVLDQPADAVVLE
ncbi:MAG: hypothetical protein ABI852_11325, partial [Gemmatimonadaceae bacterium]